MSNTKKQNRLSIHDLLMIYRLVYRSQRNVHIGIADSAAIVNREVAEPRKAALEVVQYLCANCLTGSLVTTGLQSQPHG